MGRKSGRAERLELYNRGNDKCPICLTEFTENDVRQGDIARLEHVPAKVLKKKSRGPSVKMCITCKECNRDAGKVEEKAAEAGREGWKAKIAIPGLVDAEGQDILHTGHVTIAGNGMLVNVNKVRVPIKKITDNPNSGVRVTIREPAAHYADVPWLKAAYLTLVSALGEHGYLYAEGAGGTLVRRQIMNPGETIIRGFKAEVEPKPWGGGDIILNRDPGCWVIRMGKEGIVLPRSWDDELYDRLELPKRNCITMQGQPIRRPNVKFGRTATVFLRARDEKSFRPREIFGEDVFGSEGKLLQKDPRTAKRMKMTFSVADCGAWGVTGFVHSVKEATQTDMEQIKQ